MPQPKGEFRRRRCGECRELKVIDKGETTCSDCKPMVEARQAVRFNTRMLEKKVAIEARRPEDHIRIAEDAVGAYRSDLEYVQYGIFDHRALVDLDTLAWLVEQAKLIHQPQGQTVATAIMDIDNIQAHLIDSWKGEHTN